MRMTVSKPGITIDIPRFGDRHIKTIVSDYTGTHSRGGELVSGARQRLIRLAKLVDIVILTSDSFGTAKKQLEGIPHQFERLRDGKRADFQKKKLAERYDLSYVAAFGNGNNDRLMLKLVKKAGGLAIAVENGEGCAIETILNSHLLIFGSANALDLLLDSTRCTATLRF